MFSTRSSPNQSFEYSLLITTEALETQKWYSGQSYYVFEAGLISLRATLLRDLVLLVLCVTKCHVAYYPEDHLLFLCIKWRPRKSVPLLKPLSLQIRSWSFLRSNSFGVIAEMSYCYWDRAAVHVCRSLRLVCNASELQWRAPTVEFTIHLWKGKAEPLDKCELKILFCNIRQAVFPLKRHLQSEEYCSCNINPPLFFSKGQTNCFISSWSAALNTARQTLDHHLHLSPSMF